MQNINILIDYINESYNIPYSLKQRVVGNTVAFYGLTILSGILEGEIITIQQQQGISYVYDFSFNTIDNIKHYDMLINVIMGKPRFTLYYISRITMTTEEFKSIIIFLFEVSKIAIDIDTLVNNIKPEDLDKIISIPNLENKIPGISNIRDIFMF